MLTQVGTVWKLDGDTGALEKVLSPADYIDVKRGGVQSLGLCLGPDKRLWITTNQQIKRGERYRILMSSRDVQHGFSLVIVPHSVNFQVMPGYITEIELMPEEAGEYPIVCNEFCGLGHHLMMGRIIVTE